jgi:hypothetical protein
MSWPRTVKDDELKQIKRQFVQNKNADVAEKVVMVRFTESHLLVQRPDGTALLFTLAD